ncbi:MAG: hypothetical protein ACOC28_07770 [Alkalispirochaetaceae bacterium]
MTRRRALSLLAALGLFLVTAPLSAAGGGEPAAEPGGGGDQAGDPEEQGERRAITVVGTLRLVGNEPFTSLVVTTPAGESYSIPADRTEEYRHLLRQQVEATGYLEEQEIRSADGRLITTEKILTDSEITPAD